MPKPQSGAGRDTKRAVFHVKQRMEHSRPRPCRVERPSSVRSCAMDVFHVKQQNAGASLFHVKQGLGVDGGEQASEQTATGAIPMSVSLLGVVSPQLQ